MTYAELKNTAASNLIDIILNIAVNQPAESSVFFDVNELGDEKDGSNFLLNLLKNKGVISSFTQVAGTESNVQVEGLSSSLVEEYRKSLVPVEEGTHQLYVVKFATTASGDSVYFTNKYAVKDAKNSPSNCLDKVLNGDGDDKNEAYVDALKLANITVLPKEDWKEYKVPGLVKYNENDHGLLETLRYRLGMLRVHGSGRPQTFATFLTGKNEKQAEEKAEADKLATDVLNSFK